MSKPTDHPYVRAYKRQRAKTVTWYAIVPGRGHVNLTKLGLTTEAGRRAWMARESARLLARRSGVGPALTVAEGLDAYREDVAREGLRPNSRRVAMVAVRTLGRLLDGLRGLDTLAVSDLWELRRALTRGAATSTNNRRTQVARVLESWRRQGLLAPEITRDAIRDTMRAERLDREPPLCLSAEQIGELARVAGDYAPVRVVLLTGMRAAEAFGLVAAEVDLGAMRINVPAARSKNRRARTIRLSVCPSVADTLHDLLATCGSGPVLGETLREARASMDALRGVLGWHVRWKDLRSTCAGYLHCMPGLRWTHYERAAQLGHTLAVAERSYMSLVPGIDPRATTLEEAMGLSPLADEDRTGGTVVRLA